MPFVKVLPVSALPPGSTAEVSVGENHYALCNLDGEIHALDGVCPCSGGPLAQGGLHGQSAGLPVAWAEVRLPHRRAPFRSGCEGGQIPRPYR